MEEEQSTGKEHRFIYYLQEETEEVGIYREEEEARHRATLGQY